LKTAIYGTVISTLLVFIIIDVLRGHHPSGLVFLLAIFLFAVIKPHSKVFTGDKYTIKTGFSEADRIKRLLESQQPVDTVKTEPVANTTTSSGFIDKPDLVLEKLIHDGDLYHADKYVKEMLKMAKQMLDEKSLRKYKIYEIMLADAQKAASETDTVDPQQPSKPPEPSPTMAAWTYARKPEVKESPPTEKKSIDPDDYTELISL
jgi:hypothetical protein